MKLKTRDLVIAAACCAAAAVPALAYGQDPPATATVTAVDNGTDHAWDVTNVKIVKGGKVTFRYPAGNSTHFVAFTDRQPKGCTTPQYPAPPGWQGTCEFDTAGTYTFNCPVHPDQMVGTVEVVNPTPAATPTATATPGATPPPGATPTPAPGGGGGAADQVQKTISVSLAKAQRGTRVRGSVMVARAGTKLEVAAWAPKGVLSGGRSTKPVRIGRVTRSSAPAGKVTFAIATDAKARSALRRHRRLSVTVTVALTPPGGHKLTRSAKSTLRVG